MKFCSLLRDGARMNDLFYATEMLRFDKEMEYRSVTGGLFSLGIIVAVLVGFASMIIDTLALNTINSVELITKDSQPSASSLTLGGDSKFMMAVELWGVNMSAPVRYFDVLMIQLSTANGQRQYNYSLIPLSPCTRQHWATFPDIVADFDRLAMSSWLCPPIGATLELNGDYTSNIYQYVNISVNPCIQYLNPYQPCASAAEVADIFAAHNDAIRFKIYYTNPLINSGQKDYKSYYLETTNYISFGATIGGEAYMHTCDYQISTDNSIWPYTSIQEDNGLLIQDKFQFHPYTTKIGTYAAYFLVKSPTNHIYQRQVQKISTVFSFIGGLVSAISAALFIFKAYNTLAFELTVALSIFKPPDGGDIDEDQLCVNFATFFKYYFYQFCKKIGKPIQWPVMKYLVECREEILRQLDVKALIKRVIFLEYCMNHLFEDYQLEGLQLQKPRHPTEIAKIREKIESLDTYEDHFFHDSSSKSQEKSQESQSSSSFSKKKDSPGSLKGGLFTFKSNKKNMMEFSKSIDQTPSDPYKISSPAPLINQGWFQALSKNKVHPIDPNFEKVDFNQIEIFKENVNPQQLVSKQARVSKAEMRRSINLSFLKKNAEEGNALSKKIWEQLEYLNIPNKQSKQSKFAE